jgi:hypothetical protein
MFWTGFMVGVFLGANIGLVVAGMLSASKRSDAQDLSSETTMDHAVLEDAAEIPAEMPSLPKPATYLDRYPHS